MRTVWANLLKVNVLKYKICRGGETVDALGLGPSARKGMRVRISPAALQKEVSDENFHTGLGEANSALAHLVETQRREKERGRRSAAGAIARTATAA